MRKYLSIIVLSFLIATSVSAQTIAGTSKWQFINGMIRTLSSAWSVLIGGTTTTTNAKLEIQGSSPLSLTTIASQCLQTDATGLVTGSGSLCSTGSSINTLGEIGDVNTTTLSYGSHLIWNTTEWVSSSTWPYFAIEWAKMYNSTTTLNGFNPDDYYLSQYFIDDWTVLYNATTTLNGFNPALYQTLASAYSTTTWGRDIKVTGNSTTTGSFNVGSLASASCDVKSDTNGLLYCGTDAVGSSGTGSNWTYSGSDITPSTTVGIIVNASSSIDTLKVTTLRATSSLDFWLNNSSTRPTDNDIAGLADSWWFSSTTRESMRLNGQTSDYYATSSGLFTKLATSEFTSYWNNLHNATTTYPGFQTQFNTALNATTSWAGFSSNWDSRWIATTTKSGNLTIDGNLVTDNIINSGIATTTELCFADGTCQSSVNQISNRVVFYLHEENDPIAGYEQLLNMSANGTEQIDSCVATNNYCAIDEYISTSTALNVTTWPAGTWKFNTYALVNNATPANSNIKIEVYKRTVGGTETQLFSATSTEITQNAIPEYFLIQTTQPAFSVNATDRLLVKYLGYTTSLAARTISVYYEGMQHYSFIETPFQTVIDMGRYTQDNIDETITGTWTFSWLSATTSLNYWLNSSTTRPTNNDIPSLADSWWFASSTREAMRLNGQTSGYYATSSGLFTKLATSEFASYFATNYNATTTLNGFNPNLYLLITNFSSSWDTKYNATTTLNGFTPSSYITYSDWYASTTREAMRLNGQTSTYYATSSGLFTKLGTGEFASYFATNYNATTTLNGFTPSNYVATVNFNSLWATQYNATTTLNGFTPSNYITYNDWYASTTREAMRLNGQVSSYYATSSGLYTKLGTSEFASYFDTRYNATTTLNGFNPALYTPLSISYTTTTWGRDIKITGNSTTTGSMNVGSLLNCNTIDTDANGLMSCGTDEGGAGGGGQSLVATSTDKLGGVLVGSWLTTTSTANLYLNNGFLLGGNATTTGNVNFTDINNVSFNGFGGIKMDGGSYIGRSSTSSRITFNVGASTFSSSNVNIEGFASSTAGLFSQGNLRVANATSTRLDVTNGTHGMRVVPGSTTTTLEFY